MTEVMVPQSTAPKAGNAISRAWLGLGVGLVLGLCDFWAITLADVQMHRGDVDMSLPVAAVFAFTGGALGFAIGSLSEARKKIRDQLDELRRTQQQMLEYEKLASIGRMAAGVAHEVRNPLAVIKTSAGLLLDCIDPAEQDAVKAGHFIAAEIDRLDGFIRALLDFSRPLQTSPVHTTGAELAERVRELGRDAAAGSGAALEVTGEGGPWELDLEMIARAVAALVVNGVQAAGPGGRVSVRVVDGERGGAEITIADDGPGISEALERRIYEPFVTDKAKGTGLGLSMAQRLVQAHHGVIEHLATRGLGDGGEGACFRVCLPQGPSA